MVLIFQKAKKSKKEKCETATSSSAAEADSGPSTSKKAKLDISDSKLTNQDSTLANGSTKGSKVTMDSKQKLTNGSTVRNLSDETSLFKKGSIQKDPKASTAYKSLFTSSDKARNQMKGHWVTSNPYWN